MDNGFSVLMLIFGAALLLYAAVLSGGNHKLLPYRVEQTMRKTGRKKQTKLIAKNHGDRCAVPCHRRTARSLEGQHALPDRHGRNGCGQHCSRDPEETEQET